MYCISVVTCRMGRWDWQNIPPTLWASFNVDSYENCLSHVHRDRFFTCLPILILIIAIALLESGTPGCVPESEEWCVLLDRHCAFDERLKFIILSSPIVGFPRGQPIQSHEVLHFLRDSWSRRLFHRQSNPTCTTTEGSNKARQCAEIMFELLFWISYRRNRSYTVSHTFIWSNGNQDWDLPSFSVLPVTARYPLQLAACRVFCSRTSRQPNTGN